MGSVIFRPGNILARGADLTVLPCSDEGHISAETRSHLERYGLPLPGAVTFGSIRIIEFPGPSSITRWIAYAASVSKRSSGVAAIGEIGRRLGEHVSAHPDVRVVESPLLGTGVGGLDIVEAGSALRRGFEASAPSDVVLFIYCFHSPLVKLLNEGFSQTIGGSTSSPQAGAVWDVFIAHSSRDAVAAEQLYDALAGHLRVFLDTRCLRPGDDWDLELASALGQSAITAVLVSSSTDGSYYQREEIALAIKRAHADPRSHRVIPVLLGPDEPAVDLPYGLTLKQGIRLRTGDDLTAITTQIVEARGRLAPGQGKSPEDKATLIATHPGVSRTPDTEHGQVLPGLSADEATPALATQAPTIREKSAAEILVNLKGITLAYRFHEKVAELYLGRWTQEPGWQATVHELPSKLSGGLWHCSFREVGSETLVMASTAQDVSALRPGDSVTVSGRISAVNQLKYVSLEDAIVRGDNVSFP